MLLGSFSQRLSFRKLISVILYYLSEVQFKAQMLQDYDKDYRKLHICVNTDISKYKWSYKSGNNLNINYLGKSSMYFDKITSDSTLTHVFPQNTTLWLWRGTWNMGLSMYCSIQPQNKVNKSQGQTRVFKRWHMGPYGYP